MVGDVRVELVDSMGNDLSVVKAARVSTMGERVQVGHGEKGSRGLINYLMRDRHGSPFEHNSMTFFIQAPIFVFREFHRHRVGWSYNEESARYREVGKEFYAPDEGRPLVQEIGRASCRERVCQYV